MYQAIDRRNGVVIVKGLSYGFVLAYLTSLGYYDASSYMIVPYEQKVKA